MAAIQHQTSQFAGEGESARVPGTATRAVAADRVEAAIYEQLSSGVGEEPPSLLLLALAQSQLRSSSIVHRPRRPSRTAAAAVVSAPSIPAPSVAPGPGAATPDERAENEEEEERERKPEKMPVAKHDRRDHEGDDR